MLGIIGTLGQLCFSAAVNVEKSRRQSFQVAGEQLMFSIVCFSIAFGFKFSEILQTNNIVDNTFIYRMVSLPFFVFGMLFVSLAVLRINKQMLIHLSKDEFLKELFLLSRKK